MNDNRIKNYLLNSIKIKEVTSLSNQFLIMLFNIVLIIVFLILHNTLLSKTIVIFIGVVCFLFNVYYAGSKWNYIFANIMIIVNITTLTIVLNFLIFAIEIKFFHFNIYYFIILLIFQIISFVINMYIIKIHQKSFSEKRSFNAIMGQIGAQFGVSIGYVIYYFFVKNNEKSELFLINFFKFLLPFLVILINIAICGAVYRIYLYKKYKIQITYSELL